MFKKSTFLMCSFLLICLLLCSCYNLNNINLSINKEKPNNFYYTNLLAKNIKLDTYCKGTIFYINFYKEKEIAKKEIIIIKNFINSLNKNNFIKKPKNIPKKPKYKMFFTFSKEKFIINVYNEKYISIYPWDGCYPMDYIDMTNIPISINLYNLCKFIIPK